MLNGIFYYDVHIYQNDSQNSQPLTLYALKDEFLQRRPKLEARQRDLRPGAVCLSCMWLA